MVSQTPTLQTHPAWDRGVAEASCVACKVAIGSYLLLMGRTGTETDSLG